MVGAVTQGSSFVATLGLNDGIPLGFKPGISERHRLEHFHQSGREVLGPGWAAVGLDLGTGRFLVLEYLIN